MRLLIFSYLLATGLAPAQWISVGFKAGAPVTEALHGYNSSPSGLLDTGRWTIGPTVEVNLTHGFRVEADALYRGYREQQSSAIPEYQGNGVLYPAVAYNSQSNNKVWDFPLLLKYRFGRRAVRPFVDAGYTWSYRTTDRSTSGECLSAAPATCSNSFPAGYQIRSFTSTDSKFSSGPTVGGGVEFQYRKMRVIPEVRYTHLSNPTANIVTVMVGFGF